MSRKLGDSLVVDLSLGSEDERLVDLAEMFNKNPNNIPTVVATADGEGNPNTAPVSLVLAKDNRTLLMALKRGQTTTENLHSRSKLSIEILAADDVVVGIKGSAEILKEKMNNNEAMSLWEVKVEEVKQDTSPAVVVMSGPTSEPRSEEGKAFERAMIEEMRKAL